MYGIRGRLSTGDYPSGDVFFVLLLVDFLEFILAAGDDVEIAQGIEDAEHQIIERDLATDVGDEGIREFGADFLRDLGLFFEQGLGIVVRMIVVMVVVIVIMMI